MSETAMQPLSPGERRKKQKKLKRKKMLRLTLVISAAVLLVCLIAVPVVSFVAFRIDGFKIEGKTRYTKEQIIEASGVAIGTNLLFMSAEKAQESITRKLPFIENAVVTKSLPGTLVVKVSESSRVYAFEAGESSYLIASKTFKALETVSALPEGAVLMKCPKPAASEVGSVISFTPADKEKNETGDALLDLLIELDSAMDKASITGITLINVLDTSNIRLLYQGRLLLRMGSGDSLESKLDLAKKVIESEDEISGKTQCGSILLTSVQKAFVETCDAQEVKLAAAAADDSKYHKKKEPETTTLPEGETTAAGEENETGQSSENSDDEDESEAA